MPDTPAPRRPWYRSRRLELLLLLLLLLVASAVALPHILKHQLINILRDTANWETQISRVQINFLDLSVEVEDFSSVDQHGALQLAFRRLLLDFDLLSSLDGSLVFEGIVLDGPIVQLTVDAEGLTNFERAFVSPDAAPPAPETEATEPLALHFRRIELNQGRLEFHDQTQQESFDLELGPLNLNLVDFATHTNEGGEYELDIRLAERQRLHWKGQIGIAPLFSQGELTLQDLNLLTFAHYLQPHLPYWLTQARLDVSARYALRDTPEAMQLQIKQGELALKDLALAETADASAFFKLPLFAASGIHFDLQKSLAQVGRLELKTLSIEQALPLDLQIPQLLAKQIEYDLQRENAKIGQLELQALTLALPPALREQAKDVLQLQQLSVTDVELALQASQASVGRIELQAPAIRLQRSASGEIDLIAALNAQQAPAPESTEAMIDTTDTQENGAEEAQTNVDKTDPAAKETPTETPFRWSVAEIALQDGQFDWIDQTLSQPVTMQIADIQLSLQALSERMDQAFPIQLSGTLAAAPFSLNGSVQPAPLKLDGKLNVEQLPLTLVQPWLTEFSYLHLQQGALTLEAEYALKQGAEALEGDLTANLSLSALDVLDARTQQPVAGFKSLALNPLQLTLAPMQLKLGTLTLQDPYSEIVITEEGHLNVGALMKEVPAPASPDDVPASAESSPPLHFTLQRLDLQDGRLSFTDATQTPPYNSNLKALNGTLEALSSDPEQRSTLNLQGVLDQQGQLSVQGTVNPRGAQSYTDLKINLNNVDLSATSPYASPVLGYSIQKGKLRLKTQLQREGMHIKANNKVRLSQFTLGNRVNSPEAIKAPLPLALALMRDHKGNINLNLPLEGNINDPKFSIGQVVVAALGNVLTKTVSSPFTLLGSLIGGGTDLSTTSFEPGQAELSASQRERLDTLAKALKKRPALILEVKGRADRHSDGVVLRQNAVAEALQATGKEGAVAEELLIQQWLDEDSKNKLFSIADAEARQSAQQQALLDAVKLKKGVFTRLARQRAQNLTQYLSQQAGIEPERLYVLEPEILDRKGTPVAPIAVEFGLTAR